MQGGGSLTHPNNLLIDVLCQVLAAQHCSPCAGRMPHNAANDHTQHVCLSRQPA